MVAGIVAAALAARTEPAALEVQQAIASAVGSTFKRPVGDRWGNQGMLTGSGASYDHKILEVVTNMQDAVMTRLAKQKFKTLADVPYPTPHEAAADLLADVSMPNQAKLATVTIDFGTPGSKGKSKNKTVVFRDHGIGIAAASIPDTIFQIGSSGKDGIDWLQGLFGLGGATTLRNAASAVLVSRADPAFLGEGEEDRIAVAVVQWERRNTTRGAFYLVTSRWEAPGDRAVPYSVAASTYPEFEPGTHLALIDYDSTGLGVRSNDERAFDSVFNTRLFRPVSAVGYQNNTSRNRLENLAGLERRLDDNPGEVGSEGKETLAFNHRGVTYHLPIRFRIFNSPKADAGTRRRFVAKGHVLVLTSNGQVHSHWDQTKFRARTKLSKLHDRIFVVVESDALPIEVRIEMFTADRTQMVQSPIAIRLEQEIIAFLDDWAALKDANSALIREAIAGDATGQPTLDVAQRIARVLKAKGFSLGGSGVGGGGPKPPGPTPAKDLLDDPTLFSGPSHVEAPSGRSKGVYFQLNAKDGFFENGRAELLINCDHPEIGIDEVAVGELRAGRIRVSIAIPEDFIGVYMLEATIPEWSKASGGLGEPFHHTVKLEVVDEIRPRPTGKSGASDGKGTKGGAGEGGLVALIWDTDGNREDWTPKTVGQIEHVAAADLAARRSEYQDLATLGVEIPTIVLNRTYSHLKNYVAARSATLSDAWQQQARDRYAVGVGVTLMIQDGVRRDAEKALAPISEETLLAVADSAARGILAVMPAYDQLAKESGVYESNAEV